MGRFNSIFPNYKTSEPADQDVKKRDGGCAICTMGWWPQAPATKQRSRVHRIEGKKIALCEYHYMMIHEAKYLPMIYAVKGWLIDHVQ